MENRRASQVRSLGKSFRNAFRGVAFCIRNERNMRIHLTVAAYVLAFSPFYRLTAAEYAVLFLTIALVIFAETVNTALEAVVNLSIQHYDNLARIAKDVAAGAVLVCALFAVAVGFALFVKINVILSILDFLATNLVCGCLFLISLPLAVMFVFNFPFKVHRNKK